MEHPMPDETKRPRRLRRWLILLVVLAIPVVLLALAGRKPKIEPGSILVVRLEGELPEAQQEDPLRRLSQLFSQGESPPSLHELRRTLRRAKSDSRISGVLLELHP